MEDSPTARRLKRPTTWLWAAALAALACLLLSIRPAHAALHHAALVVQHSGGSVVTRCVGFVEEQITGLQLIQRSGLQYQAQSFGPMGSAICQLDHEPSPVPSDCLGTGRYWQYFHRAPTGWAPATLGASSSLLHDGDLDGWHYAAGAGQVPPNLGFATICATPPATRPAATAARTASAAAGIAATRPPPTSAAAPSAPDNRPTPPLQAIGPSSSPRQHAALTRTGSGATSAPPASGMWLLVAAAAGALLLVGALNLRRRSR